jgi:hypothetical protein
MAVIFFGLLIFDFFMEVFVFEWLAWNGTDKNDWFFYGLVVCCFPVVSIRKWQAH